MAMQRCPNGHMWDDSRYSSCPYDGVSGLDIQTTRPLQDQGAKEPATGGARPPDTDEKSGADMNQATERFAQGRNEPGVTVGLVVKRTGIDPVVGWLVCIAGADKGRDFRIRSERNSVGRAASMDISISGDQAIHRENHAYISFNPRNCRFNIQAGEHRGLVYLNGDEVLTPQTLNPFDEIELGETKLKFVPFCGDKFKWQEAEGEGPLPERPPEPPDSGPGPGGLVP